MNDRKDEDKVLHCSYCGKCQNEIKELIAVRGMCNVDVLLDLCIK